MLIDQLLGSQDTAERAAVYLAEDPEVAQQRIYLQQKKERLDSVLKKLFEFGM